MSEGSCTSNHSNTVVLRGGPNMSDSWCTIESDPGVFTELIESIGVRGVQVEEIFSLDEASFSRLQPVYGLIFLFKWTGEKDDRTTAEPGSQPGLFFAHQVIPNACATQAILSVLLNCTNKIDIGQALKDFKSFTEELPADMKGLAISNSENIRSVHNGFSRQEPFFNDGKDDGGKKEDAFHFVAYIPYEGKVLELDGLKPGPIVLGEVPVTADSGDSGSWEDKWLRVASPAIETRIAKYSSGEIRFNLMAIVKNRKQLAQEGRERSVRRLEAIDTALSGAPPADGKSMDDDDTFELAQETQGLESQKAAELQAMDEFSETIANEEAKFNQWSTENVRRKHNYVPFAVTLLKMLAQKGELEGLVTSAATKAQARRETKAGEKRKADGS